MIEKQDMALVRGIQSGDEQAERELFFRFRVRIIRQVRASLGADDQNWEDVVSESQMGVLISLRAGKYDQDKGTPLGSYIYGITMNKIRDHFTSEKKQLQLKTNPQLQSQVNIGKEFDLERQETQKILRNYIAKLKLKYKEVLYLRYFEELSIDEISERIKLPPRRVSERINYAIKLLQKKCEKEIYFSIFSFFSLILM